MRFWTPKLRAHDLFPGRASLYVHEVARALRASEPRIVGLLEEYEATGGASGMKGTNIANRSKSGRKCWRIAAIDFDAFVEKQEATA